MSEVVEPSEVQEVVEKPDSKSPREQELIQESAKYHKRAQAAELALKAREDADKEAETARLAEQGEYKTLLEQSKAELETATKKASDWDNYQTAKKEEILKGMSEEQAEKYKGLDLTTLESLSNDLKLNAGGGNMPADRPGTSNKGVKFNGYDSLSDWAAKEPDSFKKRNGNYPG